MKGRRKGERMDGTWMYSWSIGRSINQSINQSLDQSINVPIRQTSREETHWATNHPAIQSTFRPASGLVCKDKRDECPRWAAMGDCLTNGWTESTCRISCGTKCDTYPVKPKGTPRNKKQKWKGRERKERDRGGKEIVRPMAGPRVPARTAQCGRVTPTPSNLKVPYKLRKRNGGEKKGREAKQRYLKKGRQSHLYPRLGFPREWRFTRCNSVSTHHILIQELARMRLA